MTVAAQFLAEMKGLGIELRASGDMVRYRPRHAMTPDLLERLRMHKAEILASLANGFRFVPRKPWNPSPQDEAFICGAIERDKGLPSGSVRLYSPEEFRRLFGDKW
jgi:hypothetical protein